MTVVRAAPGSRPAAGFSERGRSVNLSQRPAALNAPRRRAPHYAAPVRRGFRPRSAQWWTGALFAVGSLCFLVAALASLWSSADRAAIGVTFFTGSLFFTTAAVLQHGTAIRDLGGRPLPLLATLRHPSTWPHRHVDVLATLVQLLGTVLFNVNTLMAMEAHLTARQADLSVWAPDAIGSICFLIASELAFCGTCRTWFAVRARDRDWWIAAVNLLGSIAFGIAAVASFVLPGGDVVGETLSNAATAAGAVCFLVGAVLLIPHSPRTRGLKVRLPRAETGG